MGHVDLQQAQYSLLNNINTHETKSKDRSCMYYDNIIIIMFMIHARNMIILLPTVTITHCHTCHQLVGGGHM